MQKALSSFTLHSISTASAYGYQHTVHPNGLLAVSVSPFVLLIDTLQATSRS